MKTLLAFAVSSLALVTAANATLQLAFNVGGTSFFCADNSACDLNPAIGVLQIGDQTINGVQLNGSIQSQGPGDVLNTSSLSIINNSGALRLGTVAIGGTGFAGPASSVLTSGSGTWQTALGSNATLSWFADPLNAQGATTPTDTPGTLIDSFSNAPGLAVDSFSHDGGAAIALDGPFSMTEQATIRLVAGGELINRGQAELAIPEPSTWAMLAIGFVGLGLIAARRRSLA